MRAGTCGARIARMDRDTRAMPARVTSARFVGRAEQLADLDDLLAAARGGRALLAFVTGDSGVGKSRLVGEWSERARDAGARVLAGECIELGDSELPYAPIVTALRPLVRAGDPVLDALGDARRELGALLPELGAALPAPADSPPQARLFELLLALLDHLGREAPVVLVVEDLHWADRSTRDFLTFLGRVVSGERLLVVATYRADELHRRHPLRPVLAALERSERARRIELAPFTRAELGAQLEDILGTAPDEDLTDRLLARSEGNALWAEELLAAGPDGRGDLPSTLRDALMLRVEALSAGAQDLLRILAAGQRVEEDVLRELGGLEPRELRDALREAVGQRLVEVDADGRYRFRHALLREAVHEDLLPGEHADLHRALGEALERRAEEALAERTEIAHHFAAAGDRPRALAAAVRAAGLAEQAYANGEAAAMLERALELWGRVDDPAALAGGDRIAVLRRAAQAHAMAGDHARMRSLLERALAEVDRVAEPRRTADLLERLGRAQWSLGHGAEALCAYDEALAVLPPGQWPERATVLAAQTRALMLAGRYDAAVARSREALESARATGNRAAQAGALDALGFCLVHLGEVEEGEAALRAAMQLAREDGRLEDLGRGYGNLSEALFLAGRAEDGRRLAHAGLAEVADAQQCRWLSLELSAIDFHLGNWDAAEAHAASDAPGDGMAGVLRRLRHAELALGRGDRRRATALLEEARLRASGSLEPQWHGPIVALLAEALRRAERFDQARALVQDGLHRVPPGRTQAVGRVARIAAAGAAVEAHRAERARARGRREEAEEAARRARELAGIARAEAARPHGEGAPLARAHAADAEADAARAAGRPDPGACQAAVERWDALGHPYAAALARHRLAEALAARGDRPGAAAAVGGARAAAARLGAAWLVEELDALARRARLRPAAVAPEAPGRPLGDGAGTAGPPDDTLGLTAREREVLVLLADGHTNRAIGEALFMAEKTASVHVSRILAKLDVRTRTEAAAVAHRLGLAAEPVGGAPPAAGGRPRPDVRSGAVAPRPQVGAHEGVVGGEQPAVVQEVDRGGDGGQAVDEDVVQAPRGQREPRRVAEVRDPGGAERLRRRGPRRQGGRRHGGDVRARGQERGELVLLLVEVPEEHRGALARPREQLADLRVLHRARRPDGVGAADAHLRAVRQRHVDLERLARRREAGSATVLRPGRGAG
jgi:DNA-binding CsgD family transcriptional regulator/tetratricopeptide (TPR) repeat protein